MPPRPLPISGPCPWPEVLAGLSPASEQQPQRSWCDRCGRTVVEVSRLHPSELDEFLAGLDGRAACLRYQLGGDGSMVLARARSGVAIAALVAAAVACGPLPDASTTAPSLRGEKAEVAAKVPTPEAAATAPTPVAVPTTTPAAPQVPAPADAVVFVDAVPPVHAPDPSVDGEAAAHALFDRVPDAAICCVGGLYCQRYCDAGDGLP